ncbi:M20 aminoacylase family protein [Microvirga sp. VF16]|uniref:M20 aminoacylase family protein n=1 Tax=Microvirga sp. VF16 TaxID=2807101 RepID=UPI00193E5169|nr:M20 aminoacylase family protein [Microvirga sp. VF16]QRM32216.1 amidohydrolase [Microvirga sp. VF16]
MLDLSHFAHGQARSDLQRIIKDAVSWRRDFHQHPELLYAVVRTAGKVAERLRAFGCDQVVEGIGQTGVVGIINGQSSTGGPTIAIRADMDALPITEQTGAAYQSLEPGMMHACGHDGHTSILLGAARYLAQTRNFSGRLVLIFQPAEEGGKGAQAMVNEGLMERFGIEEVYALHNMPGLPVGQFAITAGPIMAASDRFKITVNGRGGHAASPHLTIDPLVISAYLVTSLQTIVSRSIDPLDNAVVTVGTINGGQAPNVIADQVVLRGTVRSLNERTRKHCQDQLVQICDRLTQAFGGRATVDYDLGHPVTLNHTDATRILADAARCVVGADAVDDAVAPFMGSEDFAFMLHARPGAYIFMGNGDSAPLHHSGYDFNDEAMGYGIGLWIALVEARLGRS